MTFSPPLYKIIEDLLGRTLMLIKVTYSVLAQTPSYIRTECFLLFLKVVIGPDITLKPRTKITLIQKQDDDGDFGMDELALDQKQMPEKLPDGKLPLALSLGYLWLDREKNDLRLSHFQRLVIYCVPSLILH